MPFDSKVSMIPLCEPSIGDREREYVNECLNTGWVSSVGEFVTRFEKDFAARLNVPESVAVSSGTAALHLALLAVGVKPDEEVIISTMTFIAPANAIRYVGACPVFIDADDKHWQMDFQLVRRFLEEECDRRNDGVWNRVTGRKVSAILPVHILGHPVDMDVIMEIAEEFNLKVVEDSTESLGASVRSKPTGTIGHVGCFSFNGNKLLTTGGGGMVVSKVPGIAKLVRDLSTQAKEPGGEYIHSQVGYNYRLTNVQAALGCAQLEQIDDFLLRKKQVASSYRSAFAGSCSIRMLDEAPWANSAHWLTTILVGNDCDSSVSRALIQKAAECRIMLRPLWQPMHLSPAHTAFSRGPLPVADRLYAQGVSLPSSVNIDNKQVERVIDLILKVVS